MLWQTYLRNDENRPSLTSRAVAKERQDVSSKNTVDEMANGITGANVIGVWALSPANTPEKMQCVTETCHGNEPQVLFVARTTMAM